MLNKDELLAALVTAFTYVERFDVKDLDNLSPYRLRKIRGLLESVIYELIGFDQYIAYKQASLQKYIRVIPAEDGEKFLFKPYKIKDLCQPDFPIALFFKPFVEQIILLTKAIQEHNLELEIIRWFWPSVRDERTGSRHKLLHKHAWGKAVDVLIKGWSPDATFHFFKKHFSEFQPGFFFVELPDSVHLHFVFGKSIFVPKNQNLKVACNNISNPNRLP